MVYQALFIATLAPAVIVGFRRGGDFRTTALVLLASWLASYVTFYTPEPIWANAVSDVLCTALIAALCHERSCLAVGILFGAVASLSIFYGWYMLPVNTYTVAYAHTVSIFGHLQNIALLLGASDDGIRNRIHDVLRSVGRPVRSAGFHPRRSDLEDSEKG